MTKLADELKQPAPSKRPVICGVATALKSLPKEDAAALIGALLDRSKSEAWIASKVTAYGGGVTLSRWSVGEHRRGHCPCGKA